MTQENVEQNRLILELRDEKKLSWQEILDELRKQGFTERATFIVDRAGIVRFKHIYDLDELPTNQELFEALGGINSQQ